MKRVYDNDISPIDIEKVSESIYKIIFRENIKSISSTKIMCDEYTIFTENSSDKTIDEFVKENKSVLLDTAIAQDEIKVNENKINNMKTSLTNTDYKVLKNLENFIIGIPFESDLSSVCSNRQYMRDSINNIQTDNFDEDDLLSQTKQRKINEISLISQSTIINGIEFDGKHYRLNTTDQINISALNMMAQMGNKVPYHADGEVCRIFEPEEMIELAKTSTSWVVYHTTYFNLLKHQILNYTTIEEVESVYYGFPLKEEYQQIIDTITGGAINETE